MTTELYRLYRPKRFKDVIGQQAAVKMLTSFIEKAAVPHFLMFTGSSGCGKTTLARILATKLKCMTADFCEINAAESRGIDTIREIKQRMGLSTMNGGLCRFYLFDEGHKLSSDAQNCLLKMLEDTPDHVYFVIATTDPHKLIATIRSRATEIKVTPLSAADQILSMRTVLDRAEKKHPSDSVLERIAEVADGNARKALVILNQVIDLGTEEEQLQCVLASDVKEKAIELARALIKPKPLWRDVSKILSNLEEDPEQLRYLILGYASSVLLKSANNRAAQLIDRFESNFYDGKKASLILACYELCNPS